VAGGDVKLVVVESPAKAKKIREYLGGGYAVVATVGHFRELPDHEMGVDTATFDMTYEVKKPDVAKRLKEAAASASEIILATDPDREGEAIAWHVAQVLRLRSPRRAEFREITAVEVKKAIAAAGALDQNRVDAQQARRGLDRLVGYEVSPLLRPFGPGHSAGRVQSATLHLVVLREQERERFVREPYWTLSAQYAEGFSSRYATVNDKGELEPARLRNEAEAREIASRARGPHVVRSVHRQDRERRPKPPFTTSTLQQAGSVVLGLKPDETMKLAQSLFEAGHISYHRTDSVALSAEAVEMARSFIGRDCPAALPAVPPVYKSKANAQAAHEAIRPTHLEPGPEGLEGREAALYDLIRRRFLASQSKPAVVAQTTVAIVSADTTWRARGEVVTVPGFLRYLTKDEDSEKRKASNDDEEGDGAPLPPLAVGQRLTLRDIEVMRKETKPPPRFTQATLVKEMERTGIGRPATYANTVAVLFAREYVAEEKAYLYPTSRGRLIDEMLGRAFPALLETAYTAAMEERLDDVEGGRRHWKAELREWYAGFEPAVKAAPALFAAEIARRPDLAPAAPQRTDKVCPRCEKPLLLRTGKRGPFLACSGYPGCEYTADPSAKASEHPCPKCGGAMEELAGTYGPWARCLKDCGGKMNLSSPPAEKCPRCQGPMRDRGTFLGCAAYPTCNGTIDKKALEKGKKCPKCGAWMREGKNARGKFWGCSRYPECRHLQPIAAKKTRAGAT
jgi:DNA topoisomerase-1